MEEAKSVLRKMMPVARRVLGESDETTLRMRWNYAWALYKDAGATLDDRRKAMTTLEEIEPTVRRVLGGAHPFTTSIEAGLQNARAALAARETPPLLGACSTINIRRCRLAPSLEDLLELYTPLVKLTDEEEDLLTRRTRSVGLLA